MLTVTGTEERTQILAEELRIIKKFLSNKCTLKLSTQLAASCCLVHMLQVNGVDIH
jgi:hypothetical protein